jgi:hypothetical protein
MWKAVWLLALFSTSALGLNVEPRSLTTFSDADIVSLGTTPDPLRHIDPYNPESHLYKILIPRARESALQRRLQWPVGPQLSAS